MKSCKIFYAFLFFVISLSTIDVFSQLNYDSICGTQSIPNSGFDPNSIFGGWYKPSTSDIGGAPANSHYFPVLVVFVQFQNEPGSSSSNFEAWSPGQAPNFLDSIITEDRNSSSSWWNDYNGFALSDYWREFSRGRLHVLGKAVSIILPHTLDWYDSAGRGMPKVNKDIYDLLIQNGIDWPFYDKWKITSKGNFLYEPDELVDMMYTVFRTTRPFLTGGYSGGIACLGFCEGHQNNRYLVHSNPVVKIFGHDDSDSLGSGVRVNAFGLRSLCRQTFLDVATHEHAHYLFEFNHKPYGKMEGRGLDHGWEFGLSPWEVVKLGYIKREIVNYNNPTNYLYDYASRGEYGVDTNEVLQVPIADSTQFFLIANRRKVSQWDKRMGGDTLADYNWQYLKNVNPEYGKGLYIYHVKNGYDIYRSSAYTNLDIDMECADGLWNWISAGVTKKRIDNLQFDTVYKRQYSSYANDYPDSDNPGYTSGRDEMSKAILFTPGSPDNFSTPIARGTHSIYTNENDYWYSFASSGDRWDGWNVGYNEIFSPYSSPSTRKMNNDTSGIFIWYRALDNSNNKATIEIYRVNQGGKTEAQILQLTPPSRPIGLRVLPCDSLPTVNGYKRIKLRWNHNMEPDMEYIVQGYQSYTKEYKIYRNTTTNMSTVPSDAMQYSEQYYDEIATVYIDAAAIPEYTDTALISVCNTNVCTPPNFCILYPVRYRVQAIDKYDSASVLSDLAKTEAWSINGSEGPDNLILTDPNIPKEYSLKQNFPNPFNPVTNIQYDLPFDNFVTIKLFDILGKEVMTIVNEFKNAGRYIVSINASNLSSGIYYYKIESGSFEQVRKMILLK